jgi:reverse gyrase
MTRATFHGSLRAAAEKLQDEARQIRHRNDPVAWAEDVLGVVLWSKQKEILRSIAANKRTAVKSCHSIGKTYIDSVAAAWWVSTRNDSMVQSTAPTYNQVHAQLWEAIRKLHIQADLAGRVTLGDQWLKPMIVNGYSPTRWCARYS